MSVRLSFRLDPEYKPRASKPKLFRVKSGFSDLFHIREGSVFTFKNRLSKGIPVYLPKKVAAVISSGSGTENAADIEELNELALDRILKHREVSIQCNLDLPRVFVIGAPNSGKTYVTKSIIKRSADPSPYPWGHYRNLIRLYSDRFILVDTSSYTEQLLYLFRQSFPDLSLMCVNEVDNRLFAERTRTVFVWPVQESYYRNKPLIRAGIHFPVNRIQNLIDHLERFLS